PAPAVASGAAVPPSSSKKRSRSTRRGKDEAATDPVMNAFSKSAGTSDTWPDELTAHLVRLRTTDLAAEFSAAKKPETAWSHLCPARAKCTGHRRTAQQAKSRFDRIREEIIVRFVIFFFDDHVCNAILTYLYYHLRCSCTRRRLPSREQQARS